MYLLRDLPNGIEIAKFEDHSFPEDIYFVTKRGYCNCPSFKKPCKHIRLIDQWKRDHKKIGNIYDMDADKINYISNIME